MPLLPLLLLWAAVVQAEPPQDRAIVTLRGEKFEHATVTRVSPIALTITHASGVATIPFVELSKALQDEFHYDAAAAAAYEKKQAEAERAAALAAAKEVAAAQRGEAEQRRADRETLDRVTEYLDAGGKLEYDRTTNSFYDPELAAAQKRAAVEFYRKHGYWPR